MNNNLLKFLFILFITINTAGATGLQWFGPAPKIGCINSMKQFFILVSFDGGKRKFSEAAHDVENKFAEETLNIYLPVQLRY